MGGDTLAQVLPTATSLLALALSLLNLWLQRRDRSPRLGVRVRYEYRAGGSLNGDRDADDSPPQIHDASQEGLYLLLGDFLREHGPERPKGSPVIRFALSNEGERPIYLDGVRLVLDIRARWSRERLVLDPVEGKVHPYGIARGTANVLHRTGGDGGEPVELIPGQAVGYKFELIRLANVLRQEGHAGNLRLALEVTDRLGNAYRRSFSINTDLWSYPEE